MLALFIGAMPLMAYQYDVHGGSFRPHHGNESAYQALGLDAFPRLPVDSALLSWPWLLSPLLAQAAALYASALPGQRRALPRTLGFVCALGLPQRLLADDLWWAPVATGLPADSVTSITVSFEGGWWLLHAGGLLGLAAFVLQAVADGLRKPAKG